MYCPENEIRVFYNRNGKIDKELDSQIESCLTTVGFRRWASGLEIGTGIRDLAFEPVRKEIKK